MPDFSKIGGFDWDDGNSRKSIDKHAVNQREAEEIFQDSRLLILDDDKHSQREPRFQAYGVTADGRKLCVVFTLRKSGTLIRVVSARDMSRRERARYEEEA
jgi:uncharacterized DUF497 family protein